MMKPGEYFYSICGKNFEIYQEEEPVNGVGGAHKVDGERVYFPNERELAKKRVYELNGWPWRGK